MADYFTEFSCILDVGSSENAAAAIAISEALDAELEETEQCALQFQLELDSEHGPGALWISSDGSGDPEHVIMFALRCAEAFELTGRWGFVWGLTCSKLRLDGFGGGAQLLDLGKRCSLAWVDCTDWLMRNFDAEDIVDDVVNAKVARSSAIDGV